MVELRKSGRIREAERVRKEFKSRIEASESARAGNAERESEGGDGGSSA